MAARFLNALYRSFSRKQFFFAKYFESVSFWVTQRGNPAVDPFEELAAKAIPGLARFDKHFTTIQLAEIFRIPFLSVRGLVYDEAMNALLGEQKLSAYRKRVQKLKEPSKK